MNIDICHEANQYSKKLIFYRNSSILSITGTPESTIYYTNSTTSLQIANSSLVGITITLILESGLEMINSLPL